MRRLFHSLLLLPILLNITCSQAFQSGHENLEPNTASPEMSITEQGYLTLAKSDLEKEYLLQAAFIDTSGLGVTSPAFQGTQSRIVYFKKQNDSLFLMESPKGLLTSEEIPAEWILTQFKIIQEEEEKIVFDFNEGMKNIFIASDWYSSDDQYGRTPVVTIHAPHSFLKEIQNDPPRTSIRQIAQLDLSVFGYNILLPIEVLYYLEPYNPDPEFKGTESPGFDRAGFFEVNPVVRPSFGDFQTYISRWNIKKPITYHISDNTPPEWIEAIKEGVLYWNKAFSAEIVQVEMAPAGIRAPNPDYNIIQWITYHTAPFAYADAQMDPRTGEILHAQIYLPSTWTVPSLSLIDQMEKSEGDTEEEGGDEHSFNLKPSQKLGFGLKGFSTGLLCEYPRRDSPANLLLENGDKTTAYKMVRDFLRAVVAHEVGHTLGLRHNFAASTSSEVLPETATDIFENYLHTGEVDLPGYPLSSVMDYLVLRDDILAGHYIGRKETPPLPYDRMAIEWAYYGALPNAPLEETLYCPDTLLFQYDDCEVFDGASHPFLSRAESFQQRVENLPNLIAMLFLMAKSDVDEKIRKPVGRVPLEADLFSRYLTTPLRRALGLLKDEGRSLLVERGSSLVGGINAGEQDIATTQWLNKAIRQGEGVSHILSLVSEKNLYNSLQEAYEKFVTIIENPNYRKGQNTFGEAYEFTDQEIKVMKQRAETFFKLLAQEVTQKVTALLAGERNRGAVPAHPAASEEMEVSLFRAIADLKGLETTLGNWAEYIITDNAEAEPTFDGELRLMATTILLPFQGPTPNWQKENRERVLQILLEKLAQRYEQPFDAVQPAQLAEEQKILYEIEMMIVQILSGEMPVQQN